MTPATSSVIAGLAGKASLVIGVLGLGVGTAAAAGADVPLLTPPAPVVETSTTPADDTATPSTGTSSSDASSDGATHGAAVSEFARTTELEGCEKGQAVAELASGGNHEATECSDETADESSEDSATAESSSESSTEESTEESSDDSSSDANHGQIVSDFARTTELEGCEKGQAVAELASGGNHVAKDCGGEESSDEPATTVAAAPAAPADLTPVATAPGRSGDAPGRSGDAPGRSGDAPKGGNGGNGKNGNGRNGG